MENLKGTLSWTLTGPQLRKIYELLDEEERLRPCIRPKLF